MSVRAIGNTQSISASTIFLACNFSNKSVKRHFDRLKKKWEDTLPVYLYISDQVQGKGARDLWKDITQAIKKSTLSIFDVTSFRPNVILELGFALANKRASEIFICRDLTPDGKKRKKQKWLLSDISHLHRIDYRTFNVLDDQLLKYVMAMVPVRNFNRLIDELKRQKKLSAKAYIAEALGIMKKIRDTGPIPRRDFKRCIEDDAVDAKILGNLLQRYELARPEPSKDGYWWLYDNIKT